MMTNDDFQEQDRQRLLENYEVLEKDKRGNPTGSINYIRLAKLLYNADNQHYIVIKDNLDILYYNGGYYEENGENIINQRTQYYVGDNASEHIKKETVGWIRNNEYTEREKLNPPLNLINVKNGVLDINTSKLLPHNHKDLFLFQIPIDYIKKAKCKRWEKFIKDVLYQEDIPFIQEVCGYLLYRGNLFAIIVILLGFGRNGKTTFIKTLSKVMGEENITHIPLHTIAKESYERAKLYGKHANLCSEIGASEIKDTSTLKSLTGNDPLSARKLYHESFSFVNHAKLISSCNILPEIGDRTYAMTERLAILEFPNRFERGSPECDPNLYEKLTTPEELSGIFNWMLEGLKRLLKNNTFSKYRDFDNVTEYLKQSQDPVKIFVDTFIDSDPAFQIQKEIAYTKYRQFCIDHGYPTLNSVWFSRKFKQFGPLNMEEGQPRKGGHNRTWKGIKFKDGVDSLPINQDSQDILEVQ